MNAKWLEKMVRFREGELGKSAIETIFKQKIINQIHLIKTYTHIDEKKIASFLDKEDVFLIEAKFAKKYWYEYKFLLPKWIEWQGRKPHGDDFINQMLDIGYHFITEHIKKRMETLDIPYELGLLHKAQSKKSAPLAYDFVEWLRPSIDHALLSYLRQKKKPVTQITGRQIGYFLSKVKKELAHKYFHKKRGDCITLSYWIDLVLLELRGSASNQREFRPLFPLFRHESRCANKKHSSEMSRLGV